MSALTLSEKELLKAMAKAMLNRTDLAHADRFDIGLFLRAIEADEKRMRDEQLIRNGFRA